MSKKAKKLQVKKSVLEWCNQQVIDDKELSIHWEGGGDSGWAHFEIDGATAENEYTEYLVNKMYDVLDYGSWAGEFNASGSAVYNPESQAFEGIDEYSEDETMSHGCNIVIQVPKKLWYDSINIDINCHSDDQSRVTSSFNIKNGFLSNDHINFQQQLDTKLEDEINAVIDNFIEASGKDYRGIWQDLTFELKDGVINGDFVEYTIDELGIGTRSTDEKDIYLEITADDTLVDI
jgi:hypothetical protein